MFRRHVPDLSLSRPNGVVPGERRAAGAARGKGIPDRKREHPGFGAWIPFPSILLRKMLAGNDNVEWCAPGAFDCFFKSPPTESKKVSCGAFFLIVRPRTKLDCFSSELDCFSSSARRTSGQRQNTATAYLTPKRQFALRNCFGRLLSEISGTAYIIKATTSALCYAP